MKEVLIWQITVPASSRFEQILASRCNETIVAEDLRYIASIP